MNQPAPEKCCPTCGSVNRNEYLNPYVDQCEKENRRHRCSFVICTDRWHGVLPVEPQPALTSATTDAQVAIAAALNHGPFQPLSQECRKSLREALERLRLAVETVPVVQKGDDVHDIHANGQNNTSLDRDN